MAGVYSYEFRTLLQEHRRRLLDRGGGPELINVEAALARLADGSFGECASCGGDIERSDLKADPTLRRCRACRARFAGHDRVFGG